MTELMISYIKLNKQYTAPIFSYVNVLNLNYFPASFTYHDFISFDVYFLFQNNASCASSYFLRRQQEILDI